MNRSKKKKVFVTEGRDAALTGVCVFFTRASAAKAITTENIHRVRLSNTHLRGRRTSTG